MGVLHDGALEQLDVRGDGDDVVDIDELHALEVGAVGVDTASFEGDVVVRVDAEGAQKPFESRLVGVHVEQHADPFVAGVARDGEVVLPGGQLAAHGLVGGQRVHHEQLVQVGRHLPRGGHESVVVVQGEDERRIRRDGLDQLRLRLTEEVVVEEDTHAGEHDGGNGQPDDPGTVFSHKV